MIGETSTYPLVDPTTFDLVILGTGLPAAVISAAASAIGKSVLHLDPNPFYGSSFSSLPPDELSSYLKSQHAAASDTTSRPPLSPNSGCPTLDIRTSPVYSHFETLLHSPEPMELSRKFNLDLSGPRVLFCAGSAVDLLLKSGASQYLEFKSVDASLVLGSDGQFWKVPDSRAATFTEPSLAPLEKTRLTRFFNTAHKHLASYASENNEALRISQEDLESPFVEFMEKKGLTPKIISAILYATAMVDHDQDDMNCSKDMIKTKDGIDRLALYQSSVGRFKNASGALIYPIYGQGELSQAFCRRAAVKGCLYVLRMPVIALLLDQGRKHCVGVKLISDQDIFCQKLVMDPCFMAQMPLASDSPDFMRIIPTPENSNAKVARSICIIRGSLSLHRNVSNILVVYPPKSLYPEQVTSIRALQIGKDLAVCPPGMFVLYLSALCDGADQGKKILNTAIHALLSYSDSGDVNNTEAAAKPTLLWSALYIQELTMGFQNPFESIHFTPLPDGNIDYDDVLEATKKLFQEMYPHEEFFPEMPVSDNLEDDEGA